MHSFLFFFNKQQAPFLSSPPAFHRDKTCMTLLDSLTGFGNNEFYVPCVFNKSISFKVITGRGKHPV